MPAYSPAKFMLTFRNDTVVEAADDDEKEGSKTKSTKLSKELAEINKDLRIYVS